MTSIPQAINARANCVSRLIYNDDSHSSPQRMRTINIGVGNCDSISKDLYIEQGIINARLTERRVNLK